MAALVKSRVGAGHVGTLLMVAAFLAVAGFLYWLSQVAVPTESPDDEAPRGVDDEGLLVDFAEFSTGTDAYVDQTITLRGVTVTQKFGPHAFWTTLSDEGNTSYLVHLSAAAIADSVELVANAPYDLSGTVHSMTDSVLDAWAADGDFVQENDRFLAEYAIDFLEAAQVAAVGPETGTPGA